MDLERGPRYQAYAELRETKLRMKYLREEEYEQVEAKVLTPPIKKQVKFQGQAAFLPRRKVSSSLVAQSVPDFSSALRKENKKPPNSNVLPTLMELTPPSKGKGNKGCCVLSSSRGSKSANAGEKKTRAAGGLLMPRKSYASIHELKTLSSSTANAINGDSSRLTTRKTVLGYI